MQRRELLRLSLTLLGTAASASVSRALLAGAPLNADATAVFSSTERATVALLSDMIIPPTDTPGAVAAGVPQFIASIYREWYTETERAIFQQGLRDLDADCREREAKPFAGASDGARLAALQAQEKAAEAYQAPPQKSLARPEEDEKAPFFRKLKELVVLGYYTSEVGATQELAYLPMPGKYDGDYEFAKMGRQWSN